MGCEYAWILRDSNIPVIFYESYKFLLWTELILESECYEPKR
jgi:hypothetical protein